MTDEERQSFRTAAVEYLRDDNAVIELHVQKRIADEIERLEKENSQLKATLIKDYELYRAEVEAMSAQVKQLTAETVERRLHNKQIIEKLTETERLIEKPALDRLDGR